MSEKNKLVALPIQVVETQSGLIISRGTRKIHFSGRVAQILIPYLLKAFHGEGTTSETVAKAFPEEFRSEILSLIRRFVSCRLLVPVDQSVEAEETLSTPLDVFFWDLGTTTKSVLKKLSEQQFVIVGINEIARYLYIALQRLGLLNLTIVDDPLLRNNHFFDPLGKLTSNTWGCELPPTIIASDDWLLEADKYQTQCLIATNDIGGNHFLRPWNEFCIKTKRNFLPVWLSSNIGSIGPFVIPGETPCLECLRGRENAAMTNPEVERTTELTAHENQTAIGWHPSMTVVLGEVAAFEVMRVCSGSFPPRGSSFIEIQLMVGRMLSRKVLRLPYCPICSSLNRRAVPLVNRNQLIDIAEMER